MPLHLLGKKSWNVYNTENIARVRRDEAAAAAREDAEEQRMQEEDAERRLRILRGEDVTLPSSTIPNRDVEHEGKLGRGGSRSGAGVEADGRPRKKRKRYGEDDTEMEMRVFREQEEERERARSGALGKLSTIKKKENSIDVPVVDESGHICLFASPQAEKPSKNDRHPQVEAEKARKAKELEDQYTMRFSNAAGFKKDIGETPWYQNLNGKGDGVGQDVWGNEDPGRKQRQASRIQSSDPLAMIHRGVQGVKAVERERAKWMAEKTKELRALKAEQEADEAAATRKRHRKHRRRSPSHEGRRHRHEEEHSDRDSLDGFDLDAHRSRSYDQHRHKSQGHRGEQSHYHRHHRPRIEAV